MDERHASALTAHLVMLTGLLLFIAGQTHVPRATIAAWQLPALESPPVCRLVAGPSDGYLDMLTRTLVEGETAAVVAFDAPDCDE